ncbi:MAG: ammonium transporter [Aquabacterium sp.]
MSSLLSILLVMSLAPGLAQASEAATPELTLQSLKAATDIVWVVAAGALVFFMQAGFAFQESGMARAKNTVNVIMKNYCDMCFGAIAYWLAGYGLMFGLNQTGWLGTTGFALHRVGEAEYGALFFQTMFAAVSATIVSGAIAERTRFSAYIVGSMVITGVIYPIYGSWAWGSAHGGEGWLKQMGFIDFAGSSVVHAVGGWAALAALLAVGPRTGRFGPDGQPRQILEHNLPLVSLGAFILWIGWFGFNAGSHRGHRQDCAEHPYGRRGRCRGRHCHAGRAASEGAADHHVNGSIAGLVGVTSGCHVMEPAFALIAGAVARALGVVAASVLEAFRVDDVVGAMSVHVVGGVWGTMAAGLFNANDMFNPAQVGVQALGCLAAFV